MITFDQVFQHVERNFLRVAVRRECHVNQGVAALINQQEVREIVNVEFPFIKHIPAEVQIVVWGEVFNQCTTKMLQLFARKDLDDQFLVASSAQFFAQFKAVELTL